MTTENKTDQYSSDEVKIFSQIIDNVNDKEITKPKHKINKTSVIKFIKRNNISFESLSNKEIKNAVAELRKGCDEKMSQPSLKKFCKYMQKIAPLILLLLSISQSKHLLHPQPNVNIIVEYIIN
eukprot:282606_1